MFRLSLFSWICVPVFAVAACTKTQEQSGATADPKAPAVAPEAKASGAPSEKPPAKAPAADSGPAMPASVREFRALFLPIRDFQPVTGRSKRACDAFSDLQKKVGAIDGESPPPGVAGDAWSAAVESLGLCTESISEYCDDDEIADKDLAAEHIECAYKALERVTALAPGGSEASGANQMTHDKTPAVQGSVDQARAALNAFEDAFLAAWKGEPDGRVQRACKAGLFKLAARIDKNVAVPGVTGDKWKAAVTTLWQETEEFGANCDDTDDAVKHLARTLLESNRETLQELRTMLPR